MDAVQLTRLQDGQPQAREDAWFVRVQDGKPQLRLSSGVVRIQDGVLQIKVPFYANEYARPEMRGSHSTPGFAAEQSQVGLDALDQTSVGLDGSELPALIRESAHASIGIGGEA